MEEPKILSLGLMFPDLVKREPELIWELPNMLLE